MITILVYPFNKIRFSLIPTACAADSVGDLIWMVILIVLLFFAIKMAVPQPEETALLHSYVLLIETIPECRV